MVNISQITLVALISLIFILIIWITFLEMRLRRVFRGGKMMNLENVIAGLGKELDKLRASISEMERYLALVEARLRKSVQSVNTVRFNPFGNQGSNQSFASAFLNEEGDGVVISTLYSREKVGVYAKPVKKFSSEFALSEEEQLVIGQNKK